MILSKKSLPRSISLSSCSRPRSFIVLAFSILVASFFREYIFQLRDYKQFIYFFTLCAALSFLVASFSYFLRSQELNVTIRPIYSIKRTKINANEQLLMRIKPTTTIDLFLSIAIKNDTEKTSHRSRRDNCRRWNESERRSVETWKWIKLILINCLIIRDHIFMIIHKLTTTKRGGSPGTFFTSTVWYLQSSWFHNSGHWCLKRSFLIVSIRTIFNVFFSCFCWDSREIFQLLTLLHRLRLSEAFQWFLLSLHYWLTFIFSMLTTAKIDDDLTKRFH